MKNTSLLACVYLMGGAAGAWAQQSTPTEFGPNPELAAPEERWLPTLHIATAKGWGAYGAPQGAPGTQVSALARGLQHPRWLYVLPNGDVLVAEEIGRASCRERVSCDV
jgi:glucose/arabinose dehydrogenase